MRIDWTPPLRPAATRRDERGAAGTDRSFSTQVSGDTAPPPVSSSTSISSVDGLFALQEVVDALTGRRRAVARGGLLLDRLDELRLALLTGSLPPDKLRDLERLAREQGPLVDDPNLREVLAEIELRVAVELAKLEMVP